MIFQNSMGPRKSKCDIPNGTTQGWACIYKDNNVILGYIIS
jgi:hypothetical protein